MKIYILGSGGVGGYFGAKLAMAGNDITFLARGEHAKAIKNNGLMVKSIDGDFVVKDAKVVESISESTNPDLVIVSVKTYDTESIAKELNSVISKDTSIITFQNGIENDLVIKKYLDKGNVYPGVAYVISRIESPGVINHIGGLKKLIFGSRDEKVVERLKEFELSLQKARIDASYSDDIVRDIWTKFAFILPFAGLTSLCRSSVGSIQQNKDLMHICKVCIEEVVAVAKALKINLPSTIIEDTLKKFLNTAPDSKSSLLNDIEANKRTEIETLHGALVCKAKELNIEVPINQLMYGVIKDIK